MYGSCNSSIISQSEIQVTVPNLQFRSLKSPENKVIPKFVAYSFVDKLTGTDLSEGLTPPTLNIHVILQVLLYLIQHGVSLAGAGVS